MRNRRLRLKKSSVNLVGPVEHRQIVKRQSSTPSRFNQPRKAIYLLLYIAVARILFGEFQMGFAV